jgi:hypothetical protein
MPAGAKEPSGLSEQRMESIVRGRRPTSVRRAMSALNRKDDERAAREADRALRRKLSRGDHEMMMHAGCVARLRMGDLDAALEYCDGAVNAGGKRHWAHLVNRGNLHLDAGRHGAATADFEAADVWLAKNKVRGEPVERVRLAMEYAATTAAPASPASMRVSDDVAP